MAAPEERREALQDVLRPYVFGFSEDLRDIQTKLAVTAIFRYFDEHEPEVANAIRYGLKFNANTYGKGRDARVALA